jgi:hypothetical protein
MAQRQGLVRVDSHEVQGEGSFVVVRKIGYAQKQAASRMLAEACGGKLPTNAAAAETGFEASTEFLQSNDRFTQDLLTENVVAWNWVDDEGQALPLPKDGGVVEQLTDEEVTFLVRTIQGGLSQADEKN